MKRFPIKAAQLFKPLPSAITPRPPPKVNVKQVKRYKVSCKKYLIFRGQVDLRLWD